MNNLNVEIFHLSQKIVINYFNWIRQSSIIIEDLKKDPNSTYNQMTNLKNLLEQTKPEDFNIPENYLLQIRELQDKVSELNSHIVSVSENATGQAPCEKVCEALASKIIVNNLKTELTKVKEERDYFKNGMAELQDYIDKMEGSFDFEIISKEILSFITDRNRADELLIRRIWDKVRIKMLEANKTNSDVIHENLQKGFIAGVEYAHKRPDVISPNIVEMVAHDYSQRILDKPESN